ncbi:bifunctional adenosylcobinamide kinase/adenosylcobinamide-phosphate guanylyltransferase [Marinobacter zhejiangensis]|uniref:Bifunctional adenosylcobalamin biosynthesis protein n=1 Tax=Marinobacter zhejiangensis TaxID=488535 RepID=A0A1I4M5U4_9GAMM|nr:bifunctional adenosylcobinamide kinase/adenosylcobinamide-phosphate guanylyltransferase [Marinobacter zhejiangensis]SFL98579.1 adenosylcobinamide kinase /adenosylcobinamide-phosphate guanylyltransferase [Marinobacter zhejiangensis]
MSARTLVLGGIRSGKTGMAERMAAEHPGDVVYVATATAGDAEMADRIRRHQQARPDNWGLREAPVELASVLAEAAGMTPAPCLLVDCMSLWVSNLLHAGDDVLAGEKSAFLEAVANFPGALVIVSNEVGLGTIGMDPLTRRFCDQLGWLNQALAERCDRVVMSVAGLPLVLKG